MKVHVLVFCGIMLPAPMALGQSSCIEVVDIGNNHGFYNGCNSSVLIGYSSDVVGDGTIGPISPGRREVTATPRRYNLSWRACYYGDWANNSCSVR